MFPPCQGHLAVPYVFGADSKFMLVKRQVTRNAANVTQKCQLSSLFFTHIQDTIGCASFIPTLRDCWKSQREGRQATDFSCESLNAFTRLGKDTLLIFLDRNMKRRLCVFTLPGTPKALLRTALLRRPLVPTVLILRVAA